MIESIGTIAGAVVGMGGLVVGAGAMFLRGRSAVKEGKEAIRAWEAIYHKYKDVDDDVQAAWTETMEFWDALRGVFRFR